MGFQTASRLWFPITRYCFTIFLQIQKTIISNTYGYKSSMLTLNSIWRKLQCTLRHLPSFQKEQTVSQPKADGSWRKPQLSPCNRHAFIIHHPTCKSIFSYLSAGRVIVKVTIIVFPWWIHVGHLFEEVINTETRETYRKRKHQFWGYVLLIHIFLKYGMLSYNQKTWFLILNFGKATVNT